MTLPFVARSAYELALAQIAELSARCSELEARIYVQHDNALVNAGRAPIADVPRARAARAAPKRWSVDALGAALERQQHEKAMGRQAFEKGSAN